MPAGEQRLLLGAAVGTSVLLLAAALAGHAELLIYAAPMFLVAIPLLAGRYVGVATPAPGAARRGPSSFPFVPVSRRWCRAAAA
jgi:hypothetical protein